MTPPIRFLVLASCGWIGVRAALALWAEAPASGSQPEAVAAATSPPRQPASILVPVALPQQPEQLAVAAPSHGTGRRATVWRSSPPQWPVRRVFHSAPPTLGAPPAAVPDLSQAPVDAWLPVPAAMPRPVPLTGTRGARRWSGSAWLLLRPGAGAASLAPGGTLGGTQAGARVSYRLIDSSAGAVRLYGRLSAAPTPAADTLDGAIGVEWQPLRQVPVAVALERRHNLAGEGRSALAAVVHGGVSERLGHFRLDAYGQAGAVGLGEPDLFADGALRLSRRIGPIELGAGAWAAAQPGAQRLDVGPTLGLPVRIGSANARLSLDWRMRVAGDASPDSGAALTLGADF